MIVAFLPKLAEAFKQILPILFVSFVGGHGNRNELIVSMIGVLGGFGAIGAYVTTRFEIADGQIVYRTGWIFRKDRRIPLSQIQNVNLRQGLLERLLKVVTLDVEMAGGKGAELKLSVLSEKESERLRIELMAESSHPHEVELDEDVYRISRHDLLLGAVTEHHTIAFLVAVLPIIGFGRFVRATQIWMGLPPFAQWILGIAATLLALVAGWIFGAWQYVTRYGGFTVRREPGVTRVAYGLITKVQVAIRPVRIEYASITSTPWQRLVGRETLSVGTAGSFGEQGKLAKLALMIRRTETSDAIEKVIPGLRLERLDWRRFPRFYPLFIVARGSAVLLISCVMLVPFFLLPHSAFRWYFLILPMTAFGTIGDRLLGARRAGFAVDEGFVAVRQGFFRQRVEIMPMAKIEVAMLHQPPWWRRAALVSMSVKGMVHAIGIPMVSKTIFEAVEVSMHRLAAGRLVEPRSGVGLRAHK